MQNQKNITFIIFSYNEAHRIEYPIRCHLPYGDVLVVDNFSSDGTAELAKKLGARVLQRDNSGHFGMPECKEEADIVFPHIRTDWVYWGFADDIVPQACLEKYSDIAKGSKYKVVVQKFKTMLYRADMEFLPANTVVKFFKVGALEFLPFGQFIHGIGPYASHVKKDEILFLPPLEEYSVHHFSVYTTEKLKANHNKYSTVHAGLVTSHYIKTKIITAPLLSFLVIYFFQGAFIHGFIVFVVAIEYSYYSFMVNIKAYEKNNNITLTGIEDDFRKKKEWMLNHSAKSSSLQKVLAAIKIAIFSRLYLYKHLRNNIK